MAADNDWSKPKARAIPKEGYFTLQQGRYGPTYPRTPACHGFTIIAKIIGTHDGTFDMTIPRRPIRKRLRGLPAFTTIRGGAYFFLPGTRALRFLASGQAEHVS